MADLSQYLDCSELTFWFAAACIIFNPLFWNAVARWEYRTHIISRLFGSPYLGCYSLGAVIISLALYRSHCFSEAMSFQPQAEFLKRPAIYYIGAALVAMGGVLVISSFLALGFVGTYLGDYFGILMDKKVTGFPFNVMENPMYWGSTANYLGLALFPFTEEIYRTKEKSK
ncbi:phosphatidylethanolamine N-methyltransferase isoform 3-T3 [Mantella aurantiaca]